MNHYFSENQEQVSSNPNQIRFTFKDVCFTFHTNDGVFSKKYIDYGSRALLDSFVPNDLEYPILDMGAGYGPLGVVISKVYQKEVHCCEINQRAYELLKENILLNKVSVIAYHSNLFEKLSENIRFSSVVTNPPIRAGKETVFAIYTGAYQTLVSGGELWVVIQKKQGAPSSKAYLEQLFGNCEIINRDKGYYILKSIKK